MITPRLIALATALAAILVVSPRAVAGEFDACQEIFLAPVFISSHAGNGGEVRLGAAPGSRIEIRAKIEGHKTDPEVLISPPDLSGDIAPIGTLWPEKGSPGKWFKAHAGDTFDLKVVGYPLRKETTLASFRIHLGKLMSENGYALFSLSDDRVFALHIAASAWDGSRTCSGLRSHEKPHWSLPPEPVIARPARAMLDSVRRANHCKPDSVAPECDAAAYSVDYRDVDGDKQVDAVISRTPVGGSRIVAAIWMRDAHGDLASAFEGRCEGDLVAVSVGVLRCMDGPKMNIIEFHKGRGRLRAPTQRETDLVANFDAEERGLEAGATLRAVFVAQQAYQRKWHRFTDDWLELDFLPERGNFYSYYLADHGPRQVRGTAPMTAQESFRIIEADTAAFPNQKLPPAAPVECSSGTRPGVTGDATSPVFTALALADLDNRGHLDCWSVSSGERKAADGSKIAAGEPFHHPAVSPAQHP